MGNFIKENKALAMFLFASLLLLVVIVAILTTSFVNLAELKRVEQNLVSEIEQRGGKAGSVKDKPGEESVAASIEKTGYPSHLLASDMQLVADFFKQAFTWSGNGAYEKARAHYIDLLGEHNSFVDTYLGKDGNTAAEFRTGGGVDEADDLVGAAIRGTIDGDANLVGEANEQELTEKTDEVEAESKVDLNRGKGTLASELSSEMKDVEIIPLRANRDVIHYSGFITYYVGDKILLENKTQLNPETAIIEFSIADTENGREIYDVEAWSVAE